MGRAPAARGRRRAGVRLIELLVNNAGLDQLALYPDFPSEQVEQIIAVNLTAPMFADPDMVLPQMLAQREGHVVNIASVAGLVGVAYNETYAATKHAVVGFTRSLAATAEGEGWPIGFSCILPSFIDGTGMYADMQRQSGASAPLILGSRRRSRWSPRRCGRSRSDGSRSSSAPRRSGCSRCCC